MGEKLNPKEAIYGFVGWLSGRKETIKIGASCDCAGNPDLIEEFSNANQLDDIAEDWAENLVHPSTERGHKNEVRDAAPFWRRLQDLINEFSEENKSDTPDFILARYLDDCLKAFNKAVNARREWHSTENTKDWHTKI